MHLLCIFRKEDNGEVICTIKSSHPVNIALIPNEADESILQRGGDVLKGKEDPIVAITDPREINGGAEERKYT